MSAPVLESGVAGGGDLMGSRVEPLQICVDRTGGVPKYEATVYGEHLLSKVAGNFYKGNREQ